MKWQLDNQQNKDWLVLNETVTGASHKKIEKPNQDAISWSSAGEAVILAIADGHGSDKYFRSDTGSKYAVQVAITEVEDFLEQLSIKDLDWKEEDFTRIKHRLGELPKSIVARWREKIKAHLKETPFFTKKEWQWFNDGEALPNVTNNPIIPYGATLLVTLVTAKFIFCLQLGDGDIVFIKEDGQPVKPIEDDKRLLANETTSLCTDTAEKDFRQKFLRLINAPPALIMLSTDGYANSFKTAQGFLQVGGDILNMLREKDGLQKVQLNMEEWLNKATDQGSGDDITVGIICHLPALQPPFPVTAPRTTEEFQQNSVPQIPPQQEIASPPQSQQLSPSSHLPGGSVNISEMAQNAGVDLDAPTIYQAQLGDQTVLASQPQKDVPKPSQQFKPPTGPLQEPKQFQKQKFQASAQPIVVSQSGKGNYTTITDALQDAPPDSIIHIHPGTYRESLSINRNVTLIAQGEIVIESLVPCLTIEAQEVHAEGFTIKGRWRGEPGKESTAAIEVITGRVNLERFNIMSKSKKGVRARGIGSKLNLYECRIHDTGGEGIVFDNVVKSLLEKCTICDNTTTGIKIFGLARKRSISTETVETSDTISINGCAIYDNGQGGIAIQEQGVVQVNNCFVRENKSHGILITQNSQVTVQGTEVNNNADTGIVVDSSNLAAISSQCIDNKRNGITVQDGGFTQVNNCFVRENKGRGFLIIEKSRVTLQKTEVSNNADAGIVVDRSALTVISSQCVDNGRNGIVIQSQGTSQLTNCTIRENKGYGILISENSGATIQGGSIDAKKNYSAIVFTLQSTGDVKECMISSHNDSVIAREQTKLSLYKCTIDSNSYCLRAEKQSTITANDCFAESSLKPYKDQTSEININYSQQDSR